MNGSDAGEDLRVRPAGSGDYTVFKGILDEAARSLHARGIRQWMDGEWTIEDLDSAIARGEVFLAWIGGEPVGTVTLIDEDRPGNWRDLPGDALYLHRLAIRPERAGQGLGLKLLGWSEARAAAMAKESLRLDCWSGNSALRRYYETAGYEERGDVEELLPTGVLAVVSRYEKRMAEVAVLPQSAV